MPVCLLLARTGMRQRLGALVGLAVVLALGLGVAIASIEAAVRTDRAYPSYLEQAEVGELVVNPSLNTDRAEEIIASTPGVRSFTSDSLLTATADSGEPRLASEDGSAMQARVSTDGRYVESDRPAIHEGRMPGRGSEAVVNLEMAEAFDLQVGDTLPLAFWATDAGDGDPDQQEVRDPLGRTEARVVGIGVFPDEVLVDGLYPRHRVLLSQDLGARFDCRITRPDPSDTRSLEELATALFPPGCSTSYRYFSLRVEGGDSGVGAVSAALGARFAAENEQLPAALRAMGIGYEVVPTVTADERRRVQRSLDPAVTALQLFGAAAGISTVVVGLLAAMRIARRDEDDARIWRDLGATRSVRIAGVALPLLAAAAAGLAGSVVVGWLASGAGPVASARAVDPAGRLGLSGVVVLGVLGGSGLLLAAGIALATAGAARSRSRSRSAPVPPARRSSAMVGAAQPTLALGIRAATAGAGGRALLAASVAAVGAVLATLVFSASLDGLVSRPQRFGWPYDVAATVNFGYGGTTDRDAIAESLDRHPDVERWGLAHLSGGLTINGETMPFVAASTGFDALRPPVVKGELPVTGDDIALGAMTAARLGLGVGATVTVTTPYGSREAKVRGLVVLPPLGPFQADRASLGTGALLSAPFIDAILREAEKGAGMEPGQLADGLPGFVAIDLRPGADPGRFLASIAGELSSWDTNGAPPFVYPEPVRPATVANVAAMRTVPTALAALLALAMAVGLMLAIGVAARGRRRELALLRALGCIGRQLRATIRWQALTVVGIGLALGIPAGLVAGRLAYRAFATGLGIRPEPLVPLLWVLVLVVSTVGMGVLAAAGPGHRASRVASAEVLRREGGAGR